MKILFLLAVSSLLSCIASAQVQPGRIRKLPPPPSVSILKVKSYYHDTVAIIWYDFDGDKQCDGAELYEKKDGYFIVQRMACKTADENDRIMEPRI